MAEWLEKAPCNTRLPSSNPAQATLQKSNLFEITVVAEDHEPNIGTVCQPITTSGKKSGVGQGRWGWNRAFAARNGTGNVGGVSCGGGGLGVGHWTNTPPYQS